MTEQAYEGWTNRETWLVALWINNEQGWQASVHEDIRGAREAYRHDNDETTDGTYESRPFLAGEVVRENVEEVIYGESGQVAMSGLATDLVGTALGRVDWRDLGESFLRDVAEADAYENA